MYRKGTAKIKGKKEKLVWGKQTRNTRKATL